MRCVENIQDLSGQKLYSYALLIGGVAFSRKTIKYDTKKKVYRVTNHIDDSKEVLSEKELLKSLLGEGMRKRSLIALID